MKALGFIRLIVNGTALVPGTIAGVTILAASLDGGSAAWIYGPARPLAINIAFCLLALSLSVLVNFRKESVVGRLLAIPSIVFGFLSIYEWSLHGAKGVDNLVVSSSAFSVFTDTMPLPAALCNMVLGTILASSYFRRWQRNWTCFVGIVSGFVATGSFSVLIALLAGVDFTDSWSAINDVSPIVSFCTMLLGLSVFLSALLKSLQNGWRIRWISAPFAAVILSGTGLLWHAQIEAEKQQAIRATNEAATSIQTQLENRLESNANAISRLASRMSSGFEMQEPDWHSDASNLVRDIYEFQAVQWVDSSLHIRWVEPVQGNESVLNMDVGFGNKRLRTIEMAKKGLVSVSDPISLVQGGKGFLIYAPVQRKGTFGGIAVGVCRLGDFIESISPTLCGSFAIEASDEHALIYANQSVATTKEFARTNFRINLKQAHLNMTVTPTEKTLARWHSSLPSIILAIGVIASLMTVAALLLWEKTGYLSRIDKETKQFLEGLSEAATTAIYVLDIERQTMVYGNRLAYLGVGLPKSRDIEVEAGYLLQFIHPEDRPLMKERLPYLKALQDGETYTLELRTKTSEGVRWVLLRESVLKRSLDGSVVQIIGTAQDMTEHRAAEDELRRSKENLERVFQAAPIGMALVSTVGRWLDVNPALIDILGYTKEELLSIDFQSITHPDDLEKDLALVSEVLAGDLPSYRMEKRFFKKSGATVWILLSVSLARDFQGEPMHFISQIQDITDRKMEELRLHEFAEGLTKTNLELEQLSRVDALTGVYNRRHFDDRLAHMIETAERYGRPLSLIMLDIDHFKKINDDFGHEAGDNVLKSVAKALSSVCRNTDMFARFGGEEFVVLCSETSVRGATRLAEKLLQEIQQIQMPYRSVTASFGVASLSAFGTGGETLLQRADAALYQAKHDGRNRVCVDSESLTIPLPDSETKIA